VPVCDEPLISTSGHVLLNSVREATQSSSFSLVMPPRIANLVNLVNPDLQDVLMIS